MAMSNLAQPDQFFMQETALISVFTYISSHTILYVLPVIRWAISLQDIAKRCDIFAMLAHTDSFSTSKNCHAIL